MRILALRRGCPSGFDRARAGASEFPLAEARGAEDTLRFYALRMRDVGMLKSTPQQIIARGTDWRFLHELKKELKA